MKMLFNIHEFKPVCNKMFSDDFIIKTINYVINDTKLFEKITRDFFLYKDMCKQYVIYRFCTPSVETMVAESIYNESLNRKQCKYADAFINDLKSIIPDAENFVELVRYVFGYYYFNNLIKLYENKHLWNTFYNDYYSKCVDNTFNKTRAMNINYFTERPIEDCITSSMISFFNVQKDEIKETVEDNKTIICIIPFVQVVNKNGKRVKYSINDVLRTLHIQCITNTYKNTSEYDVFLTKTFTKLLIKATKEVFVYKLLDDLKSPHNKKVNSIINDISLCYVRNANYLNKYISEGIKTFIDSNEKLINISPRYVNKVELSKFVEKDEESDKINFLDYRNTSFDRSKVNEKISKAMASYHVMNTKINAIEPSVAEMISVLNDIDASKVNRFNDEYVTSYDTEHLGSLLEELMLKINELNHNASASQVLYNMKKKMAEIALKSNYEIMFNDYHLTSINDLINTAISVYIGDHRHGDIFEYSDNNWKLKFNEELCTYITFNSFENEYSKIANVYKNHRNTSFSLITKNIEKYDTINEYVYSYIFDGRCFADLKEKCDPEDLKEICNMIVDFLEESFTIVEEIKRLENKIMSEYTKYYSRVHTLAMCLAKVDPFMNIERNVYERYNILNGNDFAEDF